MKETYYFSHDSNALSDPKILALRCDYGMEGYGVFWAVIEMLRNQKDYMLANGDMTFKAIKMMCQPSFDCSEFINKCINEYELFELENGYFYSNSLLNRMQKKDDLKQKRKQAVQNRWAKEEKTVDEATKEDISDTNTAINNISDDDCNTNTIQNEYKKDTNVIQNDTYVIQNDTKESKVKESKIKENKDLKTNVQNAEALFARLWDLYPKKIGKGQVSQSSKLKLLKHGEETIEKCINRYIDYLKNNNIAEQYIKQGSTFFNTGYVDYLDENYKESSLIGFNNANNIANTSKFTKQLEAIKEWQPKE